MPETRLQRTQQARAVWDPMGKCTPHHEESAYR